MTLRPPSQFSNWHGSKEKRQSVHFCDVTTGEETPRRAHAGCRRRAAPRWLNLSKISDDMTLSRDPSIMAQVEYYRVDSSSLQILLSYSPAGPGRDVNLHATTNHVHILNLCAVLLVSRRFSAALYNYHPPRGCMSCRRLIKVDHQTSPL